MVKLIIWVVWLCVLVIVIFVGFFVGNWWWIFGIMVVFIGIVVILFYECLWGNEYGEGCK